MAFNHIDSAVIKVKEECSKYQRMPRSVHDMPNYLVRNLWAGHFSSNEELREECRVLLHGLFRNGIEHSHGIPEWQKLMWSRGYDIPEGEFILAPVPVTGIIHGCNAYAAFASIGREPSSIAFIGYSPYCRTVLEDGIPIKKEVYVASEDLKILQRAVAEQKSLVFVDDIVDSGETFGKLTAFAKKLGFRAIRFFDSLGKEYCASGKEIAKQRNLPRQRFEPELKI